MFEFIMNLFSSAFHSIEPPLHGNHSTAAVLDILYL
jgi:hypothetical protein